MPKRDHKSLRADAAEIAAKLGTLVKGRRALLGMTYDVLAARIGCTKSHIWEIEQGRSSNPTLGTFLCLAEAFGVSPTALMAELCGEAEPRPCWTRRWPAYRWRCPRRGGGCRRHRGASTA